MKTLHWRVYTNEKKEKKKEKQRKNTIKDGV